MKFKFGVEEILYRSVTVEANNLAEGMQKVFNQLEAGELRLTEKEDFLSGRLSIALGETFVPKLEINGKSVNADDSYEIILDEW